MTNEQSQDVVVQEEGRGRRGNGNANMNDISRPEPILTKNDLYLRIDFLRSLIIHTKKQKGLT